jgi:hypothetical protein
MMSGNGFSIQVAESIEDVEKEFAEADKIGRKAVLKSADGSKTEVRIFPSRIEGFMFMPIQPESDLALPGHMRRPMVQ